jgi:hypothetical protein
MSHRRRPGDLRKGGGRLRLSFYLACVLCAGMAQADALPADQPPIHVLDDFDDITAWHVAASDDVRTTLRAATGREGQALCLDFDFGAVSGYAALRRELPVDYPGNFEFSFDLRGDAPANALQFKLIDAGGENVWWANRPDQVFPHEWQRVRFRKRNISFAWGPSQDHELRHSAQIEFVIARGREGGKGSVCFDRLAFRELPAADSASLPAPTASASSTLPPAQPIQAFDGAIATAWRSDPAAGPGQTLTLDFRQPREFGGLVLHWLPGNHASRYTVDLSDDGGQWHTVRRILDGNGGTDPLLLPESEARYVRLRLQEGPAKAYALAEIEVEDPAYGASPNAFFEAIAKEAPRGYYPRAFVGEQNYWTVLGVDGGSTQGLLSEDGAIEFAPGSASIEPFLITGEGLITWADVEAQQSLLDGYLPIPCVTWRHGDLTLRVTAFGSGDAAASQLVAQYVVENHSGGARAVTLALAVRPFQVNPPTQFLNVPGGVSPIRELSWDGQALSIDGRRSVFALAQPDRVSTADFDAGSVAERLATQRLVPAGAVKDDTGFASAVLLFRLELPPRTSRSVGIVAPLTGAPVLPANDASGWLSREQAEAAASWREKINRVPLRLPAPGRPLADTLRTALAHILINRDGPALRPGTRSYARSWIRDGAMMSDALLRLGHADVVRDYGEWFASHQFSNGKVPCCVDSRGADPVAENDSQGELIHLIAQYHRYTRDGDWLRRMWPHVGSAVSYMDRLSATQRTAQNRSPERRAFFGLMPASISHEGYSDRPAYSYWDDFWSLAGYTGAVELAQALDRNDAGRLAARREQFRSDLHASLRTSIAQHGIDYIPASADRGDFDPTATTIALSVAGEQAELPQPLLHQTFERYWQEFARRRDGKVEWTEFTPYELRSAGASVRLGRRERARELLDFFLAYRRPAHWNQWAEVVGRDARQPRFLGDMPHAWIASDFIQSALDLFAYERPADQSLVLAAGMPAGWLAGEGIGIDDLRTPYGNLSYALRQDGQRLLLTIAGGLSLPTGGLIYGWPYATDPGRATINGQSAQWEQGNELRIRALPAAITMELTGDTS